MGRNVFQAFKKENKPKKKKGRKKKGGQQRKKATLSFPSCSRAKAALIIVSIAVY